MSPWLFNVYMDGFVREVNARVQGRGLTLIDKESNDWRSYHIDLALSQQMQCKQVIQFGTKYKCFTPF